MYEKCSTLLNISNYRTRVLQHTLLGLTCLPVYLFLLNILGTILVCDIGVPVIQSLLLRAAVGYFLWHSTGYWLRLAMVRVGLSCILTVSGGSLVHGSRMEAQLVLGSRCWVIFCVHISEMMQEV